MTNLNQISDKELLQAIRTRLDEKEDSLANMENMTKELIAINEKLQHADEIKSNFLSLIKNEFNNPLSNLLNLSKMLEANKFPDKHDEIVRMVRVELMDMEFHFKNIFCAAEIESGETTVEYNEINVEVLYKDSIRILRYLIEDKSLELNADFKVDTLITTDASKLFIIILNLLSNSCEYSYESKKINFSLNIKEDTLYIEVEDFGEGIIVEKSEDIYRSFTQFSHGNIRSRSGLGLGLSVVKGYLDNLNGKISYKSSKGHTVFYVELPLLNKESQSSSIDFDTFIFDKENTVEL